MPARARGPHRPCTRRAGPAHLCRAETSGACAVSNGVSTAVNDTSSAISTATGAVSNETSTVVGAASNVTGTATRAVSNGIATGISAVSSALNKSTGAVQSGFDTATGCGPACLRVLPPQPCIGLAEGLTLPGNAAEQHASCLREALSGHRGGAAQATNGGIQVWQARLLSAC